MSGMRRKIAYSGKKKKVQLMQKRQIKLKTSDDGETTEDCELEAKVLNEQPIYRNVQSGGSRICNRSVNRYNMHFFQESKKELEQLRMEGFETITPITDLEREIDSRFFRKFDFPIRPKWNPNMQKLTLDKNENEYFRKFVEQLHARQREESKELSLFELNLETWRQLWRVLEMSDILLIVVDVRFAALMVPPSLIHYIVQTIHKHAIIILNKVDLAAPEAVVAWRYYFQETYPGLPVVLFASFLNKRDKSNSQKTAVHNRSLEGVHNIYLEIKNIVEGELDISSWEKKIHDDKLIDGTVLHEVEVTSVEDDVTTTTNLDTDKSKTDAAHSLYRDGILTVGCIGFPNVGKSTLINALKGRKVVSVSRTPGHTKHFQTIFLTKNVRLCDCPGLVFPSSTPKALQVLIGSYPISQLQVPYRSIKLMAQHLDLPKLLNIVLPDDFIEWSPIAVSEAWAWKRGFLTTKAARPDRYRAANNLLRLCLAGQHKLLFQLYPPEFHEKREEWLKHPYIQNVIKYQFLESTDDLESNEDTSSINSESNESDDSNSSNDETNADEEADEKESTSAKLCNAFALLDEE